MHAVVLEREVFKHDVVPHHGQIAVNDQHAFDVPECLRRIFLAVQKHGVLLRAYLVLTEGAVPPVAARGKRFALPLQCAAEGVVEHEIAHLRRQRAKAAPHVRAAGHRFPVFLAAYVHRSAERGIFALAIRAVGDGISLRALHVSQRAANQASALEKHRVAGLNVQIAVRQPRLRRARAGGVRASADRVNIIGCHVRSLPE